MIEWIKIDSTDDLPETEKWVLIYCGNHPKPKGIYKAKLGYVRASPTWFTMEHNRLLINQEVTHWSEINEP